MSIVLLPRHAGGSQLGGQFRIARRRWWATHAWRGRADLAAAHGASLGAAETVAMKGGEATGGPHAIELGHLLQRW